MNNRNKIMTLRQKLRASVVKRWHIVDTCKSQSVAEHSFNVCLIAQEICKLCNKEYLASGAIMYALHHDIGEVITGDIPSPTKRYYNIRDEIDKNVFDPLAVAPSDFVSDVVKLADLIDAVIFLQLYGADKHSGIVRKEIINQIYDLDIIKNDNEGKLTSFVNKIELWETDGEIINE